MGKGKLITILAIIVTLLVGFMFFNQSNTTADYSQHRMSDIEKLADKQAQHHLNSDQIFEASEDTGGLPEKVIGNPSEAKVVLYEYADYACPHCAEWSLLLDRLVEESDGKLAVVYRGYLLGFKNGLTAASAATAAQVQGCWQEYKNLLFTSQSEWTSLSGEELQDKLISCFETASKGNGNIEKFKADMASESVAKKIAFEYQLGEELNLQGTPTFRIDGETIAIKDLKETISQKLANAT